jgi:hypothetical protein
MLTPSARDRADGFRGGVISVLLVVSISVASIHDLAAALGRSDKVMSF